MKAAIILALLAAPAAAQEIDHSQHAPPAQNADPHAGHSMPASPAPSPRASPPPAPVDHAADRFYDPAAMAAARATLVREHGGMQAGQLTIDLAEIRPGRHGTGYAWNGEAWIGGDIDRFVIRSEGEGADQLEHGEVQALWSHALDPYWNLQAGVRQDIRPRPGRTYATLASEGLAPWWIEVEASLFLSDKGDISARIEAYHDLRFTRRLVLQPRIEANFAASADRAADEGSGLRDAELGLRLRYEISRRFAPYVGVVHERRFGETGRIAAAAGEDRRETRALLGIRAWF